MDVNFSPRVLESWINMINIAMNLENTNESTLPEFKVLKNNNGQLRCRVGKQLLTMNVPKDEFFNQPK